MESGSGDWDRYREIQPCGQMLRSLGLWRNRGTRGMYCIELDIKKQDTDIWSDFALGGKVKYERRKARTRYLLQLGKNHNHRRFHWIQELTWYPSRSILVLSVWHKLWAYQYFVEYTLAKTKTSDTSVGLKNHAGSFQQKAIHWV